MRGVGFLGNVVLARVLLPRDFGIVAIGSMIVSVGDFLASGGFAASLIREPGEIQTATLRSTYGFQLLVTVLVAVLATAIGVPLGKTGAVAAIMVWSLVLDTGRLPNSIVLERQMEYRLVVRTEVVETMVWNVWAVVAVLLGAGVWGVASAQIARATVGFVMLSMLGPTGFMMPRLEWSRVRPLLSFGAKFQAFSAATLLRNEGLGFVTAAVWGLSVIGLWGIVYRLTLVISVLLESLWRVSYPAMARLREAGTDPGAIIQRSVSIVTVLLGLLVVPVGGSAPALIPVVFGPAWHQAIDLVPLAAGSTLLTGSLTSVLVGHFLAEDRAGVLTRMTLLDGLAWLIVTIPLYPVVGVVALGIGVLAAALVDVAVLTRALPRSWSLGVLRGMLAPVTASVAGGLVGWLVARRLGPHIGSLLASICLGEATYVAVVLILGRRAVVDTARVASRLRRSVPPDPSAA